MLRFLFALGLALSTARSGAEHLTAERLGVVFQIGNPVSEQIAKSYAAKRGVPSANLVGLPVPDKPVLSRAEMAALRSELLAKLPSTVQSLLLVWSRPYAVECMSVTTAFAAGYHPEFCEAGCSRTKMSPLFDSAGWLPADTVGWLPAMMLPTQDAALAHSLIARGLKADYSQPTGTVYLVRTADAARNVRAAGYADTRAVVAGRVRITEEQAPIVGALPDAIAYFTGAERVAELHQIAFRAGAAADHLTSTGGVLQGGSQMSSTEWLKQGATGSYGSVSEPCNILGKFPSPAVFLDHYLRGDTLLEAYWKSVAMPGQGLFLGEPLAQPYAIRP